VKTVRLPTIRVPTLRSLRGVVLTVGGLGLLTAAAWDWTRIAGLAAGGVSLLIVNWLSSEEGKPR
jgi:hypothetical protein